MSLDTRVIAVLLWLILAAADGSNDSSDGASDDIVEVIFPEDEFSRFIDCLLFGDNLDCIAYFTVGEFNIVIDGVLENLPGVDKQEPCKYFTCDSNITVPEGELICHQQETSTVYNKRLEPKFTREPVKICRDSRCVVLYLSETVYSFNFEGQGSFENCSSSCLCETPTTTTAATTPATTTPATTTPATTPVSVSDMDTTTERSSRANYTAATTAATTTSSTGYSIENVSSLDTTVANLTKTTTVTVLATVSSTEQSKDNMNSSNTTMATSTSTSESAKHKKQIEATGSNDTLMGNDTNNNENSPNSTTIIIAVVIVGSVLVVLVAVFCVCYVRRKNQAQPTIQDYDLEMTGNSKSPRNRLREYSRDDVHDSDTNASLLSAGDDAERCPGVELTPV